MQVFSFLELNAAEEDSLRETVAPDRLILGAGHDSVDPPAEFLASEIAFGDPSRRWVEAHPGPLWLQLDSVAIDEYLELDRDNSSRVITNLAGFFADPVAETILGSILSLARGIDECSQLKRDQCWRGSDLRPELWLLRGRRVVLFGKGSIGDRLRQLLAPFGCETEMFGSDWTDAALDRALANADVIVCAVPDTPQTRGTFDRRRIARIPRSAILVNAGRGSLVDERALADALLGGQLAGAALDVTVEEPLPAAHPFWSCPNLILTQHSAGGTGGEIREKIRFFAENLERYRRGGQLVNVVDFTRGH